MKNIKNSSTDSYNPVMIYIYGLEFLFGQTSPFLPIHKQQNIRLQVLLKFGEV